MNNTLEEISNRITEAEECKNDLEDKMMEITAAEERALRWEAMARGCGVYLQAKPSLANQASLPPFDPWILLPRLY